MKRDMITAHLSNINGLQKSEHYMMAENMSILVNAELENKLKQAPHCTSLVRREKIANSVPIYILGISV